MSDLVADNLRKEARTAKELTDLKDIYTKHAHPTLARAGAAMVHIQWHKDVVLWLKYDIEHQQDRYRKHVAATMALLAIHGIDSGWKRNDYIALRSDKKVSRGFVNHFQIIREKDIIEKYVVFNDADRGCVCHYLLSLVYSTKCLLEAIDQRVIII